LSFNYNWKNTLERNVEQFQHEASLLESKGITIGPETTVLNLMTNVEEASKHDWGEPLKEPFRRMMIKYANKKHDETSQAAVLAEFAKAEKYRVISDAPGTTTSNFEEANAVFDMYEDFYGNFDSDTDTDGGRSNVSSAYATSSASDSSADEQYTRRAMQMKKKEQVAKERKAARRAKEAKEAEAKERKAARRAKEAQEAEEKAKREKKGKSKTKRSKEDSKSDKDVEELMEALNYGCKYCVRKRKAFIHPEPPSKCKWNEKAKVFRSQRVCDQLGLTFKPKDKFSYDNGGYAPLSSYKSAAEATAAESDSE